MAYPMKYQYPGDPIAEVTLMFGGEFLAANPNREIVIRGGHTEDRIPVEDIICDTCNANVSPSDPCSVTGSRLYCWECHVKWIKPHLIVGN